MGEGMISVLLAMATMASAANTQVGKPDKIHAEIHSWGSLILGWTVEADGTTQIAYRRPGIRTVTGAPTDTRILNIGPSGYAEIMGRMVAAKGMLSDKIVCDPIPVPTDGPYGQIVWEHEGGVETVDIATRCVSREFRAMHDALQSVQDYLTRRADLPPIERY